MRPAGFLRSASGGPAGRVRPRPNIQVMRNPSHYVNKLQDSELHHSLTARSLTYLQRYSCQHTIPSHSFVSGHHICFIIPFRLTTLARSALPLCQLRSHLYFETLPSHTCLCTLSPTHGFLSWTGFAGPHRLMTRHSASLSRLARSRLPGHVPFIRFTPRAHAVTTHA
jgi:hypothetical protein